MKWLASDLWSSGQRHRQRKSSLENVASPRSRHGLDWMNFFIADVQEGFGAFVAFYLADQKWSQGSIGEMLTIGRAASALSLIPSGGLTDVVRSKRALVAVGIIMIAGAVLIPCTPPYLSFRGCCRGFARDDRRHPAAEWPQGRCGSVGGGRWRDHHNAIGGGIPNTKQLGVGCPVRFIALGRADPQALLTKYASRSDSLTSSARWLRSARPSRIRFLRPGQRVVAAARRLFPRGLSNLKCRTGAATARWCGPLHRQ